MREIFSDLVLNFRKLTSAMFSRSKRATKGTKPLKAVMSDD